MKRFLLSIALLVLVGFTSKSFAQTANCFVGNLSIKLNSTNNINGQCVANFDLTFDQTGNNGFKYTAIHIWNATDYAALPPTTVFYKNPPTVSELNASKALVTIVVEKLSATQFRLWCYNFNGNSCNSSQPNSLQQSTLQLSVSPTSTSGVTTYTVKGIVATIEGSCSNVFNLRGDVWGSNAQSMGTIHCLTRGLDFAPNNPSITGFKKCGNVDYKFNRANVGIATTNTELTVALKIYKDNGDGQFTAADQLVYTKPDSILLNAANNYQFADTGIHYTDNAWPTNNQALWIVVSSTSFNYTISSLFDQDCAPLVVTPVTFQSVTASRKNQNVGVKWETSSEINNRGFYVQRNTEGTWKNVAFVFSQGDNGNSSSVLAYEFNDLNATKGVSQYRIQQVDLDGKFKYSEIRTVRGLEQASAVNVYPNPAKAGRINLLFEEGNSTRDIQLLDMAGRVLKQWSSISGNTHAMDISDAGIYIVKILDKKSNTVTTEKVTVIK